RVFGMHKFVGCLVNVWLVVAQPEHFGQSIRGAKAMASDTVDLIGRDPLAEPALLIDGALVGPDDGISKRACRFCEGDTAHHLDDKDDAGNLSGANLCLRQEIMRRGANRLPPILWILFSPACVGVFSAVGVKGATDQATITIVQGRLIASRAEIVSDNVAFHH